MATTVLIVDDHPSFRSSARALLAAEGFSVVGEAEDGEGGLRRARELRPDLVLLDVYLPDMTGLEVLRRLRSGGSPVDVIVISAARDVESIRTALHGGVLHYLVKPFDRRTFETRLRDYAALHSELAEMGEAAQPDVDRMFGMSRGEAQPLPAQTPKGIAPETLELVRRTLDAAGPDGLSASECSERTGLARVSARRYLEQLVAQQEAEVRQRYGTAGRPERRFTLRRGRNDRNVR